SPAGPKARRRTRATGAAAPWARPVPPRQGPPGRPPNRRSIAAASSASARPATSERGRSPLTFTPPQPLRSEAEVQADLGRTTLAAAAALEHGGEAEAARKEFQRAADAFRQCLNLQADFPIVHRGLAEALARGQGDPREALMHYLEAANDIELA